MGLFGQEGVKFTSQIHLTMTITPTNSPLLEETFQLVVEGQSQ